MFVKSQSCIGTYWTYLRAKKCICGLILFCFNFFLLSCTLECRVLRKYNSQTVGNASTTRIGIFTQNLDLNMSSLQIPLLMRLAKFITEMVPENANESESTCIPSDEQFTSDALLHKTKAKESLVSWAWNLLPSFNFVDDEKDDTHTDEPIGHTKDIGIYIEELNLTLKNSEFINDTIMGGIKRIRYTPIVRFTLGGLYWERVASKELEWSNIKTGFSSIYVEPLGSYRSDEQTNSFAIIDTVPVS